MINVGDLQQQVPLRKSEKKYFSSKTQFQDSDFYTLP